MHRARCNRWGWWILLVTAHTAAAQEPSDRARAVLGSPDLRFDDSLHQLTYSPDGRTLAVASSEGNWLVDLQTRRSRSLRPVAWHAAKTRGSGRLHFDFAFSPDCRTLAVVEWRGTVALYDVSSGELLGHIKRAGDGPSLPEFSADGEKATISSREGVILINPRSGEILSRWKPHDAPDPRGWVLARLSERTDLLRDTASETLHEVDRESGELLRSISLAAPGPATVLGVVAPPGLGRVAVVFDKGVGILDLAAGAADRFAWTTGFAAGDEPLLLGGHFAHAGTRVVVTQFDSDANATRLLSIDLVRLTMQRLELALRYDSAFPLALSPDASQLAVGDGTELVLFDLKRQQLLSARSGHLEAVRHVAISPDGAHVASSAEDGVRVWSVKDGRELAHLDLTGSVASYGVPLAFSPDSRSVFLGRTGFHLFDLASGTLTDLEVFEARYPISPSLVRYLPGGREVLVAGSDGYARIDANERRLIEEVPYKPGFHDANSARYASIVVSPDGQFLAHSGPVHSDPGCTVRRLVGGVVLRRLFEGGRQYLDFAADGRLFAAGPEGTSSFGAGSFDPQAVWRTAPDRPRIVSGLEVSPDGQLLVGRHSMDEGSPLRVVRTEKGDDVFLVPRPVWEGDVETVWDFSPDGASLVVGYRSGLVVVWRISP